MGLGLLLAIVLVIVILYDGGALFKRLFSAADKDTDTHESPGEILDRRLAIGEITQEEYDSLQEKLDKPISRESG